MGRANVVKISTINRALRFFGLVLVISREYGEDAFTKVWIERARKYDARAGRS